MINIIINNYQIINNYIVEISTNYNRVLALTGRVGLVLRKMGYFISKLRSITYLNQIGSTANKMFIIPNSYLSTLYQIAWGYVIIDIMYKGNKVKSKGKEAVFFSCIDTTVWHSLASFALPSLILNSVISGSYFLLSFNGKFVNRFSMMTPIVLGFATLPFIIEPIDKTTSFMLNSTIRKGYIEKIETKDIKKL